MSEKEKIVECLKEMGITDKVVHTSNNGTPINLSVVIEKFLTPSNTNESIKIDPSMESKLTIDQYGTKRWRLPNGNLHREDGPACEYSGGGKWWYLNGQLHREDGPAVEFNNNKYWYINGKQYTEPEHKHEIRSIKLLKLLK